MSNITGAGIEISVGDKQFTLSPLRFEDMEWLELKLRSRCLESARMCTSECDPIEAAELMDQAFERAEKIDIFRSIRDLFTPVGMSWILWRMAKRSHPELTVHDVSLWVQDPELMKQISPQLALLVGVKKTPVT